MCNLNQIWWLVSTQNPLKEINQQVNIYQRLRSAQDIKKSYLIKPQALELNIGTKFSYDTVKRLRTSMPRIKFFWIMGSDNLYLMHRWYNWKKLFYLCPIIVIRRPNYYYKALNSKAAKYFWKHRVKNRKIKNIDNFPAWSFINIRPNYTSSTLMRSRYNK